LRFLKERSRRTAIGAQWPQFSTNAPPMGIRTQGWIAGEVSGDQDTYLPLQCIACKQMHYVNPATGRVIGGGDDDKQAASVVVSSSRARK
jgi:hypothetical protein